MGQKRIVVQRPEGVYPLEPYAHAVRVDRTIYVSQLPSLDEQEQSFAVGDFRGQAQKVYANLAAVLRAAGAEMRHLVRIHSYITDIRYEPTLREVRRAALGDARITLGLSVVAALQRPEFLVAVDAIAVVDDD
jgi:enamine deaminase RidA (YjgF/YER057c/UK114 family)